MTRALVLALALCLVATATVRADEAEKPAVRAGIDTEIYGFIKLDTAWDDGKVNVGNFARWVDTGAVDPGQIHMTARQTRLGLRFHAPETGGVDARGRLEIDFYGGTIENKSGLLLRHAFLTLLWDGPDLSLLAGQTSDVISPLVPATINYTVAWWSGNIGYRRPQIRLTQQFKAGRSTFILQAAATAAIDAEEEGAPGAQGRVAISFPAPQRTAVVGVSGHISNAASNSTSWSGNVDLTVPIGAKLNLKAEAFTGQALAGYFGGIGQSYTDSLQTEIRSQGGWAALAVGPFEEIAFNFGGGLDDPDDADLIAGQRSRNVNGFGNVMWKLRPQVAVGAEVSWWETAYKDAETWSSWRGQLTFILTI